MNLEIYMIDGLWDEPAEWPELRLALQRAFPGVRLFNTSHENARKQSWIKTRNKNAVVLAHSLGVYEAARASFDIEPRLFVGLDGARPFNLPFALKHGAAEAVSLRRSKFLGPPCCDLDRAYRFKIPNSGHNSIIAAATGEIIDWIRGIF